MGGANSVRSRPLKDSRHYKNGSLGNDFATLSEGHHRTVLGVRRGENGRVAGTLPPSSNLQNPRTRRFKKLRDLADAGGMGRIEGLGRRVGLQDLKGNGEGTIA